MVFISIGINNDKKSPLIYQQITVKRQKYGFVQDKKAFFGKATRYVEQKLKALSKYCIKY